MAIEAGAKALRVYKAKEELLKKAAQAISDLTAVIDAGLKFAVYAEKNPDGLIDAADKASFQGKTDALLLELSGAQAKAADMVAMRTGTPTPDDVLTKYSMTSAYADYVNSLG